MTTRSRRNVVRNLVEVLLALTIAACSPASGLPPDPVSDDREAAHDHAAGSAQIVFGAADIRDRFDRVDGYAVSGELAAGSGVSRGGFLVDFWEDVGDVNIDLEVRGVREDETYTEWVAAEVTWREAPHVVARGDLGEVVHATQIRLPLGQTDLIENITYSSMIPVDEADADDSTELGKVSQGLSSELADTVQSRAAWGARKTRCGGSDSKRYRMAIHHTYTPFSSSGGYEARLRSIQAYHMDTRGWCDVGYHFLVTQDGRVWEGRPLQHRGAHVGGNNSGNVGISWVGCFHPGGCSSISSSQIPPQAMIDAGGRIVSEISEMFGIAIGAANVKPHRGHSGASTSCPGDNLVARIGDIFDLARSPGSTPAPPDPGSPPTVGGGRALGVVWDATTASSPSDYGNARIPGASVVVEGGPSGSARAGDAFFSFDLAPGTYTITASASGYASASKEITIGSGEDRWSSLGLSPGLSASTVEVVAVGASGQPLGGAIIYVPGVGATRAGSDGRATFTLDPGSVEVQVFADGHQGASRPVSVGPGSSQTVTVSLGVAPAAATGRIQGVIFDGSKASSASSSTHARLDQAIVICSCGIAKKARAGDAYWSLDVPPGAHTFTVVAEGYRATDFAWSLSTGASDWNSVGLTPGSGSSGGTPSPPASSFGQTESSWSCNGTAGTNKSASGSYYITTFGCWVDSAGNHHGDSGDNCIPWCQSNAGKQGRKAEYDVLCGGMSGPDCERSVNYYAAGADRFGCGARLLVTNVETGKAAVVAVLDRGPACWVEDKVDHWVLDLSHPASVHLFGEQKAATERAEVSVTEVPSTTPLGPA